MYRRMDSRCFLSEITSKPSKFLWESGGTVEEASGERGGRNRNCAPTPQFLQLVGVSEQIQKAEGRDNLFNFVHANMLDLFLSSLCGAYNQPILLQTSSLYKTTNVMNV
jgi:hypothetical protein